MKTEIIYNVLERFVGRQRLWRIGRWLYLEARRESCNDPGVNGEYNLVGWYCRSLDSKGQVICCFDIGAMHADWTFEAVDIARRSSLKYYGKVFEASPTQAVRIQERINNHKAATVELRERAVSDRIGQAQFAVTGENTGSSTLVLNSTASKNYIAVETTTIDSELESAGWSSVDIVKVDTEGHDYSVIAGGIGSLQDGKIGLLQFEYNWRWLDNHCSLKDVFSTIEALPYRLGKLCSDRVELYRVWHPELDRFIETNFVLIREDLVNKIPAFEFNFSENNVAVKVVP